MVKLRVAVKKADRLPEEKPSLLRRNKLSLRCFLDLGKCLQHNTTVLVRNMSRKVSRDGGRRNQKGRRGVYIYC